MAPSISRFRLILYIVGVLAIIATIPIGNAVKDFGIIHTVGIVIGMFVAAGLYWEFFGSRKKRD